MSSFLWGRILTPNRWKTLTRPLIAIIPQCVRQSLDGNEFLSIAQLFQSHERRRFDLEATLGRQRSGPPGGEGKDAEEQRYAWKYTWATDLNLTELSTALGVESDTVDAKRAEINVLTEGLVAAGADPQVFSSCVMHRLIPRYFPDRPLVSFLIPDQVSD